MKTFKSDELNRQLTDWLKKLSEEELSLNTIKRYKINIISFISFVDQKGISKDTVKEYKKKIIEIDKYSSTTANNYIVSINKFLSFIGYDDLKVKLYKTQRKNYIEEYISYSDYHRLLRCAKSKGDIRNYMILRVLGETGIRVGELRFFKVEDLKSNLSIRFKNKERIIIINKSLLADLRRFARENHIYSGYIFQGKNHQPLKPDSIRKALKKVAGYSKIKLSKVHPHAFRHYFAVRFLEAYPGEVTTLADYLGHSSLETTKLYTRLGIDQKQDKLKEVKF